MTRALLAFLTAAVLAVTGVAGANPVFPKRIALPDGFQPEGIAIAGKRFYVGSIPTGAIYRGDLRTGRGAVFVPPQSGRAAIGLDLDRGRLFVAGGPTGNAFVYDAKTGATLATVQLSTGGSFINDVVVTRRAAWFTDSFKPVLYRVALGPAAGVGAQPTVTTVPLSGDYEHVSGFNLNGIDATRNGKTLVVVQSSTGRLFTVDQKGVTQLIALAGGESVPNGDGILLDGKRLYVVQNRLDVVAKIKLAANLRSGQVLERIADPTFDVPTTIDEHGNRLYAVNARFTTPPTPTTEYWVTQFRK